MLFNSVVFIMLFLPAALFGWYLFRYFKLNSISKAYIILMSFVFYGYFNKYYILILLFSILFNYAIGLFLDSHANQKARKLVFLAGIMGNLAVLFYYKYMNFFVDNCNYIFKTNITIEKILLPLGISFFTFQQISYVVEKYRKNLLANSFLDYCFFVSFFPQLVAGPIVLYEDVASQLDNENHFLSEMTYEGICLFICGLAKKVLLADSLSILVDAEFNNIPYLDSVSALATILFYYFQLYFDFSGYTDMARGLGKMFGIVLPQNFESPLKADSIRDYWHRWHMTLSSFLTKYIYFPLGGSRLGKARKCLNLLVVFLVSGIWHGANWTFVVWGLLHGIAMVFETLFENVRFKCKAINVLITQFFVAVALSIFRANSLKDAWLMISRLFSFTYNRSILGVCNVLQLQENYIFRKAAEIYKPSLQNVIYVGTFIILLTVSIALAMGQRAEEFVERGKGKKGFQLVIAFVFVWSLISLSHVSTFLYFNF